MKPRDPEFEGTVDQLVLTLREELRQNQRLLQVVRQKKELLLQEPSSAMEPLLRAEKEIVSDVGTLERERIALLTALGQMLGHPQPARVRIAEVILHAGPENRDELLDLRDELRDVADTFDDLNAVEPVFARHRQDNVRLYVSPSRWKGLGVVTQRQGAPSPSGASALHGREGD